MTATRSAAFPRRGDNGWTSPPAGHRRPRSWRRSKARETNHVLRAEAAGAAAARVGPRAERNIASIALGRHRRGQERREGPSGPAAVAGPGRNRSGPAVRPRRNRLSIARLYKMSVRSLRNGTVPWPRPSVREKPQHLSSPHGGRRTAARPAMPAPPGRHGRSLAAPSATRAGRSRSQQATLPASGTESTASRRQEPTPPAA